MDWCNVHVGEGPAVQRSSWLRKQLALTNALLPREGLWFDAGREQAHEPFGRHEVGDQGEVAHVDLAGDHGRIVAHRGPFTAGRQRGARR